MRIPKRLLPHTIKVEPLLGTGARSEVFGPIQEWKRAYVEDKRQMVVSAEGDDVVSNSFVVLDPERILPEGSRVTMWPGTPRERVARVVGTSFYDFPRLPSNVQIFLN
jgi:hypothetical protein